MSKRVRFVDQQMIDDWHRANEIMDQKAAERKRPKKVELVAERTVLHTCGVCGASIHCRTKRAQHTQTLRVDEPPCKWCDTSTYTDVDGRTSFICSGKCRTDLFLFAHLMSATK